MKTENNTDDLLLSIEEQINKVIFSCMIIGRFPSNWSFEAYNSYLTKRDLCLFCGIVRFDEKRLSDVQRTEVSQRIEGSFPPLHVKVYDTYLALLKFDSNPSKPLCQCFDLLVFLKDCIDEKITCYSSDAIPDVSLLCETFLKLKKAAETDSDYAGRCRDEEVMGLYALESELFDNIENGCVEEITPILTAIADNLTESDRIFFTDNDDILVCLRSYFAFLWREITRVIYLRTGKRKTFKNFITIDLDINMAIDSDELVNLLFKFSESLIQEFHLADCSSYHRIIENVKKYVIANCEDDVSLKRVAENVGLSSYYLSKLFKKVEGTNFKDYVVAVRMGKAMTLMKEGNMNVNEVALSVGYSNANYFSTAFHKLCGTKAKDFISWKRDALDKQ